MNANIPDPAAFQQGASAPAPPAGPFRRAFLFVRKRYGKWRVPLLLLLAGVGAVIAWRMLDAGDDYAGIASGNGRIEATEFDIATKLAGRIKDILVDEGDFVTAGQVLAHMDTEQLEAQLREAKAQLQRAEIGEGTARSLVAQREAEREAATAVIAQRQAELSAAVKRLGRSERLVRTNAVSVQVLDDDRAAAEGAKAAVGASEAQRAASEAAIGAARSQVVDAQAAIAAAKATIERIAVDIADSALKAPRSGRVQYRIAEPGEVLAGGGRLLNVVDLSDVYMTFFLPTEQAGRVAVGADARIVLDAAPGRVIPAKVFFVADVAQFTPKTVETAVERQKLMFRVKARIPPELLNKRIRQVKTGLPGMAYVRLDPQASWPDSLESGLVQ